MPKAARRQSRPSSVSRAEPYSAIKPGDKPTVSKDSNPKTSKSKALAEMSPKELNKSTTPTAKSAKASKATTSTESRSGSFLDITLDGESTDSVPIYDTCSEVRRKITLLLLKDNAKPENSNPREFKKDGTPKPYTKAAFCNQIGCSTRQLDTFMKAKKMMGGAESPIYTGSYNFFEKKRIFEGKKKSARRLNVEEDMPYGLPLRDPNKMRFIVGRDEHPSDFLNAYGN